MPEPEERDASRSPHSRGTEPHGEPLSDDWFHARAHGVCDTVREQVERDGCTVGQPVAEQLAQVAAAALRWAAGLMDEADDRACLDCLCYMAAFDALRAKADEIEAVLNA